MRLHTLRDFEAYERQLDNTAPEPPDDEDTMEDQAPYGNVPAPLSHLYAVSRDAVQPNFFTMWTLGGESFRVYSPELAKAIDDAEAKRFDRHPGQEGEK